MGTQADVLMHKTAAVSFTLCSVDRCGNSEDLSWSAAELTARAAPAINISQNNNQGCLFFPELSISMTDLFWRQWLFWQISPGLTLTAPCLSAACTLTVCLPLARNDSVRPQHSGGTSVISSTYFCSVSLNCLICHTSEFGLSKNQHLCNKDERELDDSVMVDIHWVKTFYVECFLSVNGCY